MGYRWLSIIWILGVLCLGWILLLGIEPQIQDTLPDKIAASETTPVGETAQSGTIYATDAIAGNLLFIPPGTFLQGTPVTEIGREPNEGPQFQHTLTGSLAVMETEVTRKMWADLRARQPSLISNPLDENPGSAGGNPIQAVSWYQAVLFANLLSAERGLDRAYYKDAAYSVPIDAFNYDSQPIYCRFEANGYRLPTEGEWEYFTRAGTTGPFSLEESNYTSETYSSCEPGTFAILEKAAWFCTNSGDAVHTAGQLVANPWGLKDVHGNVWEWCWDGSSNSYPDGVQVDYRGSSSGSSRVLRGGSYNLSPQEMRSGIRIFAWASFNVYNGGFRLVRTVWKVNLPIIRNRISLRLGLPTLTAGNSMTPIL